MARFTVPRIAAALGALIAVVTLIAAWPASAAAPRQPVVAGWAVINLDGTLARGIGAVSSTQNGVDGQHVVTFSRNVAACAYTASGGEATAIGPDDAVVFTVAPAAGNPAAVFVQEWDGVLARDSYSSGFHLVVTC